MLGRMQEKNSSGARGASRPRGGAPDDTSAGEARSPTSAQPLAYESFHPRDMRKRAEDGGPGVRYADKLPPNSAARRLPSLASLWSHLYPRPLCASSYALNFLSEAGV